LHPLSMQLNDDFIGGGRILVNEGGVLGVLNHVSSMDGEASDSHGSSTSGSGGGRFHNIPPVMPRTMPTFPPGGLRVVEATRREGRNQQTLYRPKRERVLSVGESCHGAYQLLSKRDEAALKKQRELHTTEDATPTSACGVSQARKPLNWNHEQARAISSSFEVLPHKVSLSFLRQHAHEFQHGTGVCDGTFDFQVCPVHARVVVK
jgi:hypothetical protein